MVTDFPHHTPRLLSEADAAADLAGVPRAVSLPGVTSEDALRLANEIEPLTRKCRPDNLTQGVAAMAIRTLVSERDALAVRVRELEFALADLLGQIEQGHMAVGMEKSPSVQSSCDNARAALNHT